MYKLDIQLFAGTAFVVDDELPATTDLKIAWTTALENWSCEFEETIIAGTTSGYFKIRTNETFGSLDVNFVSNSSQTSLYWSSYFDECGDSNNQSCSTYKYFILNTSSWTKAQRTITTVNADASTYGLTWEDIAPASTWTVSFDSNGGTSVADIEDVEDEATISDPTAPTKSGNTFARWYADSSLTTVWDFSTDTVTEDITLYAKWIENPKGISDWSLIKALKKGSTDIKQFIKDEITLWEKPSHTVTIYFTNDTFGPTLSLTIYDGEDDTGSVLETLDDSGTYEVEITSGYLTIDDYGDWITVNISDFTYNSPTYTIDSDGDITLTINNSQGGG